MVETFACPQCSSPELQATEAGFACRQCGAGFPILDGIPWLIAEPQFRLSEWRQRFLLLAREYEQQARDLATAGKAAPAGSLARRRLTHLANGYRRHLDCIGELLRPLGSEDATVRRETLLALRTRVPMAQDLTSYYVNLHRDWVWGDAENSAALDILRDLAGQEPLGVMLVAGSGAGRLAYDVHQHLQPRVTCAADINPLLQIVAKRVSAGAAVPLWEFPIAPRTLEQSAIERTLRAPQPARAGLHFVMADVMRAPWSPGSFDTVLTPWFIDIVPQDFREVAARINRLLRPGGRWLNFGSLAFAQSDPARCYSADEALECLRSAGFDSIRARDDDIPYMRSPASRHARVETAFSFVATRRSEAPDPGEAFNLPDWLADGSRPVPLLPHFETQSLVNRIYAFVLALVDGRRSSQEIARYLVEQKLMSAEDASAAVRSFLTSLYEESRRRSRF